MVAWTQYWFTGYSTDLRVIDESIQQHTIYLAKAAEKFDQKDQDKRIRKHEKEYEFPIGSSQTHGTSYSDVKIHCKPPESRGFLQPSKPGITCLTEHQVQILQDYNSTQLGSIIQTTITNII